MVKISKVILRISELIKLSIQPTISSFYCQIRKEEGQKRGQKEITPRVMLNSPFPEARTMGMSAAYKVKLQAVNTGDE